MAQTKGKVPYTTAQRMVTAGLMSEEALHEGVASGTIAPKPTNRDYGDDQDVYLAIQKYIDDCQPHCTEYRFSVMGRKLADADAEEANEGDN